MQGHLICFARTPDIVARGHWGHNILFKSVSLTAETGPYLDFSKMCRDTEKHTLWKQDSRSPCLSVHFVLLSLHLSRAETGVKVLCELCSLTLPAESIFIPFTSMSLSFTHSSAHSSILFTFCLFFSFLKLCANLYLL